MSTLGQGAECYVLNLAVSDTAAHPGRITWLQHARIVSFQLITDGTLDGSWLIEASNDYSGAGGANPGQATTAGHWTDVTALFKLPSGSAVATVAHGSAATQNQATQCVGLGFRVIRVTFTGSGGTGNAIAIIAGGEY